jgi:hypothetical protein
MSRSTWRIALAELDGDLVIPWHLTDHEEALRVDSRFNAMKSG